MFWIEVKFSNGKTLLKESDCINETYKVWARYSVDKKQTRVQYIKAGRDDTVTGEWNLIEGIALWQCI